MAGKPRAWREWALTTPSFLWLSAFFLAPTMIVFAVAFRAADPYGGIGQGWTLDTIRNIFLPDEHGYYHSMYPPIVWRTLWMSVAATFLSLLLAIPAGYGIARLPFRWRQWVMLLIIVPSWTTFLVRIQAWKMVLHADGGLQHALAWLGLIKPATPLLSNPWAVLLVLVYTYLPFVILPIYAAAEKFDFSLTEAARDLGATPLQAFFKVFLPGVRRGVATGALMVLVPCLGAYVIPELVGGATSDMIGNVIARRAFSDRNLPEASALAAILTLVVVGVLLFMLWWQRRRDGGDSRPPLM